MNMNEELKSLSDIPESDIVSRMTKASLLAENPEVIREITKYGNVPVIYQPHKSVLKDAQRQDPGLGVLIENAMTPQEVTNLLTKGKLDYKYAQPKTIKKWETIAKNRIKELSK
jgi:hypothetical protein